jgi:aspartate racemase
MSWESSAEYYRLINQETKRRLGGHHNASSLMLTVDFAEVEEMQRAGEWERLGRMLADAARQLERGGAELVVLCTNTMHKAAECITGAVRIPMLHIADAVGNAVVAAGAQRVALLGTRFTMDEDFYARRLREGFGVEAVTPGADERQAIHDVIYNELCHGVTRAESRELFRGIIEGLAAKGAEGVILGCTEIPLLISREDSSLPVFDSTAIHAAAAVDWALS